MRTASLFLLLTVLYRDVFAWDDTRAIEASPPVCAAGVLCTVAVTPGFMAGQSTLDFSATATGLAGAGFSVEVFDNAGNVVQQRSGGVMSTGSANTLIASAQLLEPGAYRYVVSGLAEGAFQVTSQAVAATGENTPPEHTGAAGSDTASALAGVWYGIASTVGQIELSADGSYRYNGGAGGRWRQAGDKVMFNGALEAWNNGVASLKDGVLEFYWTNAEGFNNWFVFQR